VRPKAPVTILKITRTLWIAAVMARERNIVIMKRGQSMFHPQAHAVPCESPSRDQPLSDRIENQIGETMQAEFLEDIVAMRLNSRNREI
jgi:hypothetical protein